MTPTLSVAAPGGPGDARPARGPGETSNPLYLIPDLVNLDAAFLADLTLPLHMEAMLPDVLAGDPTALALFLAEG